MFLVQKSAALLLALTLTAGVMAPLVRAEEPPQPAPVPAVAETAPAPLSAEPAPAAPADPNFLTLSYTASRSVIRRGDKTDLTVTVKDTAILTRDFKVEDFDFSKLADSFSACTPTVEVVSGAEEPVTLRLQCAGVEYSGTGRSLKLSLARKGSGSPQTLEVTVNQAEEYVAPTPTPVPETPAPKERAAPPVLVTRSALGHPLAANETADIVVTIQNGGSTKMVKPLASFSASESLLIANDVSTVVLPDLEPGKSASVTLRVQAAKEIAAASQSLQVDVKYAYESAGQMVQAATSEKLSLSAAPSGTPAPTVDSATPNIVIRDFSYGEETIAAGARFKLNFRFQNMGRLRVENLVASVDGGENFALDGGTSTFYYDSLAAKGEQSQTVPLQALPTAKSGAQAVTVQFKYEYVDGSKRTAATSEIKVSVPVVQKDRFQVNAPAVPESCTVGEECVLTLNYVNRGKTEVGNVEATVEGDGVDVAARTQYVGNITAGTSGSIGFALTPNQAGKVKVVLKVSYEDPNLQSRTLEFPVELNAAEGMLEPDLDLPEEEEKAAFPLPLLFLLPIALLAGGITALLMRRRALRGKKVPAKREDWGTGAWDNDAWSEDAWNEGAWDPQAPDTRKDDDRPEV